MVADLAISLIDPRDEHRRGGRLPRWLRGLPRALGPAVLLAAWAAVSGFGLMPASQLPSPLAVVQTGIDLCRSGVLPRHLSASLYRVALGLAIGVAIGLSLAALAGLYRRGEHVIDSAMNVLRTLPVIALLPLLVMWVGIGEKTKIVLIVIGVAFPIYTNTFAAIRGVDAKLIEAGQMFGLNRLGLISRVILPGSVAGFLVGLRWAVGTAWLMLIFAETINTYRGLGYLMNQAQTIGQTKVLLVIVVIYGLLGFVGDALVRGLERLLLSWRRGFEGT
ncbi:ABC transporter permease [Candidatus Protofrankia californiensis]|uniref:ABC transporter permease n=1 Tax=Candidatus Protofrankia californiensis TaxID=1839754 RepID=UPI001F49D2D4|nr:ABC transporter permease [Candidatus Protofrankia californiensis]